MPPIVRRLCALATAGVTALALTGCLRTPDPLPTSTLTGYSGLFSFELSEGIDIPTFCNALKLFRMGVS